MCYASTEEYSVDVKDNWVTLFQDRGAAHASFFTLPVADALRLFREIKRQHLAAKSTRPIDWMAN